MPWIPRYTKQEAAEAISQSSSWADALRCLGISPRGKNFSTIRKWAAIWGLPTDHLPPYRPRRSGPRFTEAEARAAIAASKSWTESLRRLGYCPTGGNPRTLKAWAARWKIPTDHFDPFAASLRGIGNRRERTPIDKILVEGSTYSRSNLKHRLYDEGLKEPLCELCGQGELWRGRRMSLILDHANGVRNDHRIENLRIVCPNCAATLDTHCGKQHPGRLTPRECARCGKVFGPKYRDHRYCSRECGSRWDRASIARRGGRGVARPKARRVARPPYGQLLREISDTSYLAVGRKYGVSDNAVRKWVRWYENEAAREQAGRKPAETDASATDSLDEAA